MDSTILTDAIFGPDSLPENASRRTTWMEFRSQRQYKRPKSNMQFEHLETDMKWTFPLEYTHLLHPGIMSTV